jgi:tetratricopeptide (TPR) repeat protein
MRSLGWTFCLLSACGAGAPVLDELLQRGETAESRGEGERAGGAYLRATIEFEDHASAWTHYGEYLRFWKHDLPKAEAAFLRALAAPVSDTRSLAFAWRGLAEISRERRDVDAAIAFLAKSLALHPLADTHRSLSALYATERHDFVLAEKHARAAVKLQPDDPIALLQLAVQAWRANQQEDAERAFHEALRIAGCDESGAADHAVHCCVLYNGACYWAVRGDRVRALAMLRAFFATPNHRHLTRDEILADPDFASLLADADFRGLVDRELK